MDAPGQKDNLPVIRGTGTGAKNVVVCAVALHPFASVTRTEMVPGFEITFVIVVIPFDHKYEFPDGETVSVVVPPGQIPGWPDMDAAGNEFTVTTTGVDTRLPHPVPSLYETV